MKRGRWGGCWGLAAALLVLAACRPGGPAPSPVTPTSTRSLAPEPTRPPTFPPTFTPTASLTPSPTLTPTPTSTATPSATPTAPLTPTATPCAQTVGRMVDGAFPSPVQGFDQRYRIYLPPCYGQDDRLYPALYLFPGNIFDERHWDDVGVDEAADVGMASGSLPPFLIVMPNDGEISDVTSGGDWSFEGVVLQDLIPYIEDQYCVWPAEPGRAIGGISRGGYWSLEIGFRHPELFAAVGGHSPAIFDDNAGPLLNPLSTGADPKLLGQPIYMDIGDGDWLRQGVLDLHDNMLAAGIPHEWHIYPGVHSDEYWSEHVAEYLAWYAAHWPAESDYPSASGRNCRPPE